jgi:hypothetical protein
MRGDPPKVVANVPDTKLPDVPLGSVPGHLALTVTSASTITTEYRGTCLEVKGGQATLHGVTTTSGKLVLKASIVLEVPLFNKTIDLPDVTADVPASTAALDSDAVRAQGIADGTDGTCGAPPAPSGTGDGGAGSSSDAGNGDTSTGQGDGGSCAWQTGHGAACDTCVNGACCAQLSACTSDVDCSQLVTCVAQCASNDLACENACASQHPTGASIYDGISVCAQKSCATQCP